MNKILTRQLKKFFGGVDKAPEELRPFLDIVSRTYDDFEHDHRLVERSLEISSDELNEKNRSLSQIDDQLKRSSESLRTVMQALPFGVIIISAKDHIIRMINREALDLSGYDDPGQLIGQSYEKLLPADDNGLVSYQCVGRSESFILTRSGAKKPVLKSVVISSLDGETVFVEGFVDIGDRLKAEEALKISEEKYRKIYEDSTEGMFRTTVDGVCVNVNAAFASMFGYASPAEMMGSVKNMGREHYVYPQDRATLVRMLGDAGVVKGFEVEVRRKNGEKFWTLLNAHLVYDTEGNAVCLEGTNIDITERKKVQQALQANEQMLRSIFDADPVGSLWIVDDVVLQINKRVEELTGYSEQELRWLNTCVLYVDNDECLRSRELLRQGILKDGTGQLESVWKRKDGTCVDVLLTSRPIDRHDLAKGVVVTAVDISERKAVEEELKKAKEAAEKANRTKSDFLSNVSHEIRTPLHAIVGFSENITQTSDQPAVCDHAATILHESELLLRLINELLDQAKMEAGKLSFESKPFDLPLMVKEIEKIFVLKISDMKLKLVVRVAENVPRHVMGDAYRVRQILMNLVANAIKFTEKGAVTVDVQLGDLEDGKQKVFFKIKDNGVGIPLDKIKYIFDPFYQVDPSLNRKYGGTGLGTAIAKNLVDHMGGVIGCESEPGRGSTFWFEIPFMVCPDDVVQVPGADVDVGAVNLQDLLKNVRVLFAEDQEVNRDVAKVQLDSIGVKDPMMVENGQLAVDACQRQHFDIVFLDLQMPVLDGLGACRVIRSKKEFASIPIVAFTANTNAAVHEQCLAAGINEVLLKPTRINDLKQIFIRNFSSKRPLLQSQGAELPPVQAPERIFENIVLDRQEGLELFAGNAMLYQMAFSKFRKDLGQVLPGLDEAREKKDIVALARIAHKIAGSAASVSAKELSAAARELENAAHAADEPQVADGLDRLRAACERLQKEVV